MRWKELGEERCSIARTIGVFGDRWTLLILRDCFQRVRRFDDFQERLGITRHVLADRLKKLVAFGVLTRDQYQATPLRYEYRLTQAGLDMYPVLTCLRYWGDQYLAGRKGPPLLYEHLECGHIFDPVVTCSECCNPISPRAVRVLPGRGGTKAKRPMRRKVGQQQTDPARAE